MVTRQKRTVKCSNEDLRKNKIFPKMSEFFHGTEVTKYFGVDENFVCQIIF